MPLAFESMSHGTVAFGFFNIDSDMLLLDRCFFFAGDFCDCMTALAGRAAGDEILQLLKYVWRGGYPRWKNGVRPEYLLNMEEAASKSAGALFAGISFSTKAKPESRETETPANGFSDPVAGGKR